MTNTTQEEELAAASLAMFARLAPSVAFLLVLMVGGLAGNALILAVYCTRYKKGAIRSYILTMAVSDLLTCLVGLPFEVVDLRFFYNFPHHAPCRTGRVANSFLAVLSGFVLVAVAVDRRAKVCRPLQIWPSWRVKVNLAMCAMGAVAMAVPYAIMYGRRSVPVPGHANLNGFSCDADVRSALFTFYSGVAGLTFVICVTIMVVCYTHIFIVLLKRRRRQAKSTKAVDDCKKSEKPLALEFQEHSTPGKKQLAKESKGRSKEEGSRIGCVRGMVDEKATPKLDEKAQALPNKDEKAQALPNEEEKAQALPNEDEKAQALPNEDEKAQALPNEDEKAQALPNEDEKAQALNKKVLREDSNRTLVGARKIPSSTTRMMFALTTLFVINYLPHVTLHAMHSTGDDSNDLLSNGKASDTDLNAYSIGVRSLYLNVMANPIVYSFFSARFRHECRSLLKDRWTSLKDCWTVLWPYVPTTA